MHRTGPIGGAENRDAVWEGSGVVEKFDSNVIEIKWSTPIGPGYSGPTVTDGKVLQTGSNVLPRLSGCSALMPEQAGWWKRNLNTEYEINMPIWGIASTPLVVDEKIIVHVSGNKNACVVAFNKDTGKPMPCTV